MVYHGLILIAFGSMNDLLPMQSIQNITLDQNPSTREREAALWLLSSNTPGQSFLPLGNIQVQDLALIEASGHAKFCNS